jgi:hypothetical protein
MTPDASSYNPFTSHGRENPGNVPKSFLVAEQVLEHLSAALHAGDRGVIVK